MRAMSYQKIGLVVVLSLIMWKIPIGARSEIVFDSTSGYLSSSYFHSSQFGDEVRMSHAITNLAEFSFSYIGEFEATGRENVRIRFYANDGVDIDPGTRTILAPGTLLYQSELLPIYQGLNSFLLSGLSLSLPQTLTWTVEFGGLSHIAGNRAGLILYNPPSVGRSFDDFWQLTDSRWNLHRFNGNPVANFAARLETPGNKIEISQPVLKSNGALEVEIQGPSGLEFLLEFSTNTLDWLPIHTNTFLGVPVRYSHSEAPSFPAHFYRASLIPVPVRILSKIPVDAGGVRIQYQGPLGAAFELQASADGSIWTTIHKSVFPSGATEKLDQLGTSSTQYRIELLGEVPLEVQAEGVVNQVFQLVVLGAPGQKFELQASEDFAAWTTVHSGILDYAAGQAVWVDSQAIRIPKRFFRARAIRP